MARRKRSSGEGTLWFWKEKELWVGQISLPEGKRRTKYSKKQTVVKDWLLAERNKLKQGIFVADDKITLGTFLNDTWKSMGKGRYASRLTRVTSS